MEKQTFVKINVMLFLTRYDFLLEQSRLNGVWDFPSVVNLVSVSAVFSNVIAVFHVLFLIKYRPNRILLRLEVLGPLVEDFVFFVLHLT